MIERIRKENVQNAFQAFCDEAARNGIDPGEWYLEGVTGPSSWRIMGRTAEGSYVPDLVPNGGFLGTLTADAYRTLLGMIAGMRMVRQAREDMESGNRGR